MEILPSTLYWAPGLDPSRQAGGVTYANALQIGHSEGKDAKFHVAHYNSCGEAFGPLPLDAILRFCKGLTSRLNALSGRLCLITPPRNSEAYANASVLLGGYLILSENWSVEAVVEVLGKNTSELRFSGTGAGSWNMIVRHCWEGLMAARKFDWIDLDCLRDDALLESTCKQFNAMAFTYDCAWLVPSKIMVSSDPITTLCDPNPETFNDLWEAEGDGAPSAPVSQSNVSLKGSLPEVGEGSQCVPTDNKLSSINDLDELSTKASESSYQAPPFSATSNLQSSATLNGNGAKQSFRSFSQTCGVSLVIRNNSIVERGMPRPSYDRKRWKAYYVEHLDLPVPDGAVPPRSVIARALTSAQNVLEADLGAVLIHCKSGFGRSVTLACCLACYHYDIPGSALFGWARIIRPGAFNSVDQEKFILSLKGRADVERFAKTGETMKLGATASCGCVLQ